MDCKKHGTPMRKGILLGVEFCDTCEQEIETKLLWHLVREVGKLSTSRRSLARKRSSKERSYQN